MLSQEVRNTYESGELEVEEYNQGLWDIRTDVKDMGERRE